MKKDILSNPKNVKFDDLINLCSTYFGSPRIKGSHHIFKTPWKGRSKDKYSKRWENGKTVSSKVSSKSAAEIGGER